ncbi:hypothetical protein CVS40_4373 [Lucilia cuprina]|nr:hypothetical protein CVS40_4373 [Lucilia cuprina]
MATFSDEQFQQILAAMSGNVRSGSFTQCTARFKGQRDPAAVEEFLSAISVYKDIEKISDIDALRGMPLLLEDYAASWWIGVKDNVLTFEQAMSLIRSTFTPPIPDWRIFSNFFETKQQKNEPTDVFICKKRLLLSQLKVPPTEMIQINMLYGLLNINIRERVRRENVNSFEQLISASREAEMFFLEAKPVPTADSELKKDVPNVNRCSFCRIKGHTVETCFKKKKRDELQNNPQTTQQNQNSLNPRQPRQPQQSDVMRRPSFSCYGCGAPGVYRSNCTTCSSSGKDSPQYLAFNSISSTVIGHSLPTTQVEFFGLKGEAIFDSGAKTSVASLELKRILTANKCVFQDVRAEITLADGSVSTGRVMSTICNIIIGNRLRKIRLIYLPNATENRTLIGADFMEQAGIVLNMAQKYWYFEDQPRQKFSFANLLETNICSLQIRDETSPCTKAVKEMSLPFYKIY